LAAKQREEVFLDRVGPSKKNPASPMNCNTDILFIFPNGLTNAPLKQRTGWELTAADNDDSLRVATENALFYWLTIGLQLPNEADLVMFGK